MTKPICIVTGAGGFIGGALAQRLQEDGWQVRGVSRRLPAQLKSTGIELYSADIGIGAHSFLGKIFKGAEAVFHTAAKVDMWGDYDEFFRTNVIGTRSVIEACKLAGVKRLIYTSSPSVAAGERLGQTEDLENATESIGYPQRHLAYYPQTKAQAEQEVLQASGQHSLQSDGLQSGLLCCALRPHLVFGPGDHYFIPTILERAKAGRLWRVGSGKNLVDVTYIEDCVEAHLCAERALRSGAGAGRAFFISQGQPVNMWDWINTVLSYNGVKPVRRGIPTRVAFILAAVCEKFAKFSPSAKPLLTRFLVSQMSSHHYFNISAARSVLGFAPRFSVEEALEKTFGSGKSQPKPSAQEMRISANAA